MKNSMSILSVLIALAIVPSTGCAAVSKNKPEPGAESKTKAKPGTILWEYTTQEARPVGSPALGYDGNIYIPCEDSDQMVVAINRTTGKRIRNYGFDTPGMGSSAYSAPSITPDGSVIIPWKHGHLLKFSDNNGTPQWTHENGGYNSGSASLGSEGAAYYGGGGTKAIYAVDIETGERRWRYLAKNKVQCTPISGPNGVVYVGSTDGIFYALDGKTGQLKWKYTEENIARFGGNGYHSSALDERGWIYVSSDHTNSKGYLLALDSKTGERKWAVEIGGSRISAPIIGKKGNIYVCSSDGYIYSLDRDTGEMVWKSPERVGAIANAPAIGDDGVIYFGSRDRYIYAIDSEKGVIQWKVRTGDAIRSSPLIGDDGTLFVGSDDGRLYAIVTSSTGPAKSPWPMFGQNAQRTSRAPAAK